MLVTITKLAEVLSIPIATARRLAKSGAFPAVYMGSVRASYNVEQCQAVLETLAGSAAAPNVEALDQSYWRERAKQSAANRTAAIASTRLRQIEAGITPTSPGRKPRIAV